MLGTKRIKYKSYTSFTVIIAILWCTSINSRIVISNKVVTDLFS